MKYEWRSNNNRLITWSFTGELLFVEERPAKTVPLSSWAKTQLGSKDQNNILGCAKYSMHIIIAYWNELMLTNINIIEINPPVELQ